MGYTVIRDTREQTGWVFDMGSKCDGTEVETLSTGDYTLKGYEHILAIERKASMSEFSRNVCESRFDRELRRLDVFPHSFIILEFTMQDVIDFPNNSGIPSSQWAKLKVSNWFILRKLMEYQLNYKTHIIFAGANGKEVVSSIFKRIIEKYEK